ncbi:O-antigen ligase family protein [Pseudomonas sp. A-B-19]|uniref:O-antigen ligase family protein n=1 Tax=Pseudomonas sp. A-B-19 TaxID=2832405 RepID=UPI001CBEC056|nr:O-antigen ligase family protein [Pseudomonas sp. A-B-19]
MQNKIYNLALKCCFFLMLYLSTDSVELFKTGGATAEGQVVTVAYSGPLNFTSMIWAFFAFFCVVLYVGARIKNRQSIIKGNDKWMVLLLVYIFVSLFWSKDRIASAKLLLAIPLIFAFVRVYFLKFSRIVILQELTNFFVVVSLTSIAFSLFIPSYGVSIGIHEGDWQGIFTHKNGLGNFSVLGTCIFISMIGRGMGWKPLIGLGLSIFLTFMSSSTTALICLILVLTVYLFLKSKKIRAVIYQFRHPIYAGITLISVIPFLVSFAPPGLTIFDKDTTFTGRVFIWGFILSMFFERPVFGYGLNQFDAFFNANSTFASNVGFQVGSTHSGFLDLAFSLGMVGVFLVLAFIKKIVPKKNNELDLTISLLFFLSFVMVNSLESLFLSFNIWFVLLLIIIEFVSQTTTKNNRPLQLH